MLGARGNLGDAEGQRKSRGREKVRKLGFRVGPDSRPGLRAREAKQWRCGITAGVRCARYLTSESSLNIGRYMLMMITPTMQPTPTIIIGSMIEVSAWIDASTSSS